MGQKHKTKRGKSISGAGPELQNPGQSPKPGRAGAAPATGTLRPWVCPWLSAHPGPLENGAGNRPRGATGPMRGLHRNALIFAQTSGGERSGQGIPIPGVSPIPGTRFHPAVLEGAAGTAPLPVPLGPGLLLVPSRSPPPLPAPTGLLRSAPAGFSARAEAMGKKKYPKF